MNLVAEIGCVHLGDVNRAKQLIQLAHWAGADYIKLQKRHPPESTPLSIQHEPHPNQMFAYGKTYLEHRWALELTIDEHKVLQQYCNEIGVKYSTSVWDITSAREVISLNPDFIKVPSACNVHIPLLDVLFQEFSGGIHISTGMTSLVEMTDLLLYLQKMDTSHRAVIYHCTSEYPCPHEHLYLRDLQILKDLFAPREIGFSNHGYGIAMDPIAIALGASWIERHFIDDRTVRHTDAAASVEPDGFRKLSRDLHATEQALQFSSGMTEEELRQRAKLKLGDPRD